jgi:hypothetical protein
MNTSKTRWLTAAFVGCGLAWLAGGCGGKPEAPGEPDSQLSPEAAALREKYHFQALDERLAYEEGKANNVPVVLTPETLKRLTEAEDYTAYVETENGIGAQMFERVTAKRRRESLKLLHSAEVEEFIKREGFGEMRRPPPTSRRYLDLASPTFRLARVSYPDSALEGDPQTTLSEKGFGLVGDNRQPSRRSLLGLHDWSDFSFLAPESFGLVESRGRVAGFDPHKFRRDPSAWLRPVLPQDPPPPDRWVLRRLELVSLLKHDRPQVYSSEELPRMENLKKAATRDLDDFESAGLKKLEDGKDLFTYATLNRIRMVGSLRARKECLDCHQGRHGQLLGAFIYELLRDPPLKPKPN